ncbi:MAG TPA: hypothetical protein VF607_06855, partial [Verrucomicrobiae bacterium]
DRPGLAILKSDGTLSVDFAPPGISTGGWASLRSLAFQPGGGLLAKGDRPGKSAIVRFLPDGTLDNSFQMGPQGWISESFGVRPDGRIVLAGEFPNSEGDPSTAVGILDPNGGVEKVSSADFEASALEVVPQPQADGKILVAGKFWYVNGMRRPGLARLNADGSLDSAFDIRQDPPLAAYSVAAAPDGTVVVFSLRPTDKGDWASSLLRLRADGSVDRDFKPFDALGNLGNQIRSGLVLVQPDGRIVLTVFSSVPVLPTYIFRFGASGILETNFAAAVRAPASGYSITAAALDPSNRLIIAGRFTLAGSTNIVNLARLQQDGSADGGFNLAGIRAAKLALIWRVWSEPGGGILVLGFDSHSAPVLARLDSNGAPLQGFKTPSLQIAMASPGSGGRTYVSVFDSIAGSRILRLDPSGKIDPSFAPVDYPKAVLGESFNAQVAESDGLSVIAEGLQYGLGRFFTVPAPRLALISGPGGVLQGLQVTGSAGLQCLIEATDDLKRWEPLYNFPLVSNLVFQPFTGEEAQARYFRARLNK